MNPRPSLTLSVLVVVLLMALWGGFRLALFSEEVVPITYVIPLLVCVWTGRRWQLWGMAAVFAVMAVAKSHWLLPADEMPLGERNLLMAATLFNILAGAGVVQAILALREGLERRNATITAQNAELEAQAEELSQQNEEIRAQAEELAEQNEEIESQSEEVSRQNEDLVDLNARLSGREEVLEGLLQSARGLEESSFGELCRRTLSAIGSPAAGVAILERATGGFCVRAGAVVPGTPAIPGHWPERGSIAELAVREGRTVYVSNLAERSDLAEPFGPSPAMGSVLAAPVSAGPGVDALLVACSVSPGHWTQEQFRVIEWIAAQFGLILEAFRTRRELLERAADLESANRSKDRFLAMLSHELRTPLTPVLAASGFLEADPRLPEDVREDLRMIRRNVRIQSRLIDDLLDLTRISRGKLQLDRQVLPAAALLREAAAIVTGDVDAKSQRLHLDTGAVGDWVVEGDGPRLQQVFWNLLKNAVKYSARGGSISLTAAAGEGELTVSVRDHGIGFPPEHIDQLFLPFEQGVRDPERPREGGLGLGLAIAKAVVELHGGAISAHSEGPGRGAIFTVRLPASRRPEPPPASPGDFGTNRNPSALRILLVEDHGDTGRMLARLLRASGHAVDHAETAAAALALFDAKPFDIVVSDLGLPDQSGLKLMRQIQARRPGLPGICLSGFGMEKDIEASLEAGFSAHLTKPIDLANLEATIARTMQIGNSAR